MIKKVKYILLKIIKYFCIFKNKKIKKDVFYDEFVIGLRNLI